MCGMYSEVIIFFFFKQKTAYEISACLVGSEMCIRDSNIMYYSVPPVIPQALILMD